MSPGDNCPECDRRLSDDVCPCGWRAASAGSGPTVCARCQRPDRSIILYDGRPLCCTCQAELRRINACTDDDLTDTGETVRELRTRVREQLAKRWN